MITPGAPPPTPPPPSATATTAPATGITVRPAGDDDQAFLFTVYAATRRAELIPLGWEDDAAQSFLRTRFESEERDWSRHQPGAECLVIERGGQPVGRLYLARSPHEIRVMDVSILPEHQGQGIASTLIVRLLDQARASRRTVRLHVDRGSPLVGFCRRVGFLPAATRGGTWLMEWTAESG